MLAEQTPEIKVHVIGFAAHRDLIDGLFHVMMFFAIAAVITTAIIPTPAACAALRS